MQFYPDKNFGSPKINLKEVRFSFTQKTQEAVDSLTATLQELEKSDPHITGFTLYGSRVFGLETETSDFDILVYYNEDTACTLGDFNNYKMQLRNNFDNCISKDIDVAITLAGLEKNRFELHINEILIYAQHDVINTKKDAVELIANGIPSFVRTLVQPFHGGRGVGLQEYRKKIMDELESKGEIGQRAFSILMFILEALENNTKRKKDNNDFYIHYPKTISEAKEFNFDF